MIYQPWNHAQLFLNVLKSGSKIAPRGITTIEMINSHMIIEQPRMRIVTSKTRKQNVGIGIAEFIAIIREIDDVPFFSKVSKSFAKFSSNGKVIDGAYGGRMNHGDSAKSNSVRQVIKLLGKDPASRQAVIPIFQKKDLSPKSNATPCTMTLQFMIRDEKLICITNMRSNDVEWGVTYDVFMFTMLQEFIANQLGIEVGQYYHNAGSIHIYDYHFDRFNSYLTEASSAIKPQPMRKMPRNFDFCECLLIEQAIRCDTFSHFDQTCSLMKSQYAIDLAVAMFCCGNRKSVRVPKLLKTISQSTLQEVVKQWTE